MTTDFQYIPPGLSPELNALTLDEVCQHYKTHYSCFELDEFLGAYFFNRFAADEKLAKHSEAITCFVHLVKCLHKIDPFNASVGNVMQQIAPSPALKMRLKILSHLTPNASFMQSVERLVSAGNPDKARARLLRELSANAGNVYLGIALYEMDLEQGNSSHDWLPSFTPHAELKPLWSQRLAYLAARAGRAEEALTYLPTLPVPDCNNEFLLNALAISSLSLKDTDTASALLETSLQIAPSQKPIRLLRDELAKPFAVIPNAFAGRNIVIAIYSYNKADLLKQTLDSLRASNIGSARCIVLLNGCTDHSQQVVEEAKSLFMTTQLESIVLPVNVGAPAARNYIVQHALSDEKTELVAFLDDDVTIDKEWLAALVTAIDEDPQIGAVGCKVTNPGNNTLQYLYRDVSIARPGLFRLSLSTPLHTLDNGLYNVRKDVDSIMGCCHLIRRECLEKLPEFDIRFSPSQLDDVAFHLDLRLLGYKVRYVGQVTCCHYRSTGFASQSRASYGNSLGNDVKFYYRFENSLPTFKNWQVTRNNYPL
ncbi:glycosyltransferase [Desulfovibrio mangrovi]|uniref:glycosyltransferase n=1 Tax=Desulfovibrio mangrovi TaxID=2976983 RepID=UPI002246958F|nr:glycosyltransferase [Desulfovibrio mangrovi]UZP66624.1 glycosyltransferase [Desulfovibrio mangrovi]